MLTADLRPLKNDAREHYSPDHPYRRVVESLSDSIASEEYRALLPSLLRIARSRE
jgi:hypothetical protein